MKYHHRFMESKLKSLARSYYVLVVCGPRQSGKSTLVQHLFHKTHNYINLEDLEEKTFALKDPRGFLERFLQQKVIIDEAQNAPELFSYIQGIVDQKKKKAQFILTGSSHFDLIAAVSQSLAGRSAVFELLPLTQREISHQKLSIEQIMFKGGYPSVHFNKQSPVDWYKNYCKNYVERDLHKLLNIKYLGTFQLFLQMCAARCGQIINYSSFANDCGVSPNTIKEWMNILEASFIIYRLLPHYKNYSKRLIKSPKLYFYDTGVVCSLLGITSPKTLITHSIRGGLFESWVISELKKRFANMHKNAPLYYWKNNQGIEIDLIVEKLEKLIALEIKSGKTLHLSFLKNLDYFHQLAPKNIFASYLVYGGQNRKGQRMGKNHILSWKELNSIPCT